MPLARVHRPCRKADFLPIFGSLALSILSLYESILGGVYLPGTAAPPHERSFELCALEGLRGPQARFGSS